MKTLSPLIAFISASLISFAATARAQDPTGGDPGASQPPPPPQMDQAATGGDQGGPPPMEQVPPPDQGAPQPEQAPPPADQGGPAPDQAAPASGQSDDQGVSFQNFYDQLGDQGTWVNTDNYGYVFQPRVSDPDWAPYRDGHWVYTDDGWTWVSDESWGWATYHYGRWCNIDGTGWCWVPGYRWAPAWVSWRYGGGYCGWAPLPPETFVGAEYGDGGGVNVGFHFGGDVDVSFNIGPGCYNFVPVGYMGERNYRGHYLDRSRNYVVINNTTNITNINIGGAGRARNFRGVAVGGPPLAQINAHSRERIQNVRLTEASRAGRSDLRGNSLAVYAPRVNAASVHQARPGRVGQTINNPTLNRGDSISHPLAVNSRMRPAAPSAEAVEAARAARQHAPASAKVANEQTAPRTQLSRPLTSMQPVGEERHNRPATTAGANQFNRPATVTPGAQHPAAIAPQAHEPQHSTAESAETGAPVKSTPTYHPQTQVAPAQTYHPQTQVAPGQTYHPQTQVAPPQTYHPPTQTAPTYHPQAETHRPDAESGGNRQAAPSGQGFHSQAEAAPQQHQSAAPAPQQHQSAPAPQQHQSAAPAPQQHSAPSGGNSGNGNKGNGQGGNQQNQH